MALPVLSPRPRRNDLSSTSESTKARLFLALACLWPLLFFFFSSTVPSHDDESNVASSPHKALSSSTESIGLKFRHVLDRVDIIGYGPTHPRLAVVIVGDTPDHLILTLESVFANTDMNRIFMAVVVADGVAEDATLLQNLYKIDSGAIPHWHGQERDLHKNEAEAAAQADTSEANNPHGKKVHVLFNEKRRGIAESRKDAIDFIRILEQSHIESGLKSEAEDLILLLLQAGSQLTVSLYRCLVTLLLP
jgi:hypothetical protein